MSDILWGIFEILVNLYQGGIAQVNLYLFVSIFSVFTGRSKKTHKNCLIIFAENTFSSILAVMSTDIFSPHFFLYVVFAQQIRKNRYVGLLSGM